MKTFCFIYLLCNLSTNGLSQSEISKVLRKSYEANKTIMGVNTFVRDTVVLMSGISFNMIKSSIAAKDTFQAKEILSKGFKFNVSRSDMLAGIPLKQISLSDFEQLDVGVLSLTDCEKKIIRELDSLNNKLSVAIVADSNAYVSGKKKEDMLFKSKCFISYSKKVQKLKKTILIYYPIYKYKNHYLVCFSYYHSKTDVSLICKII